MVLTRAKLLWDITPAVLPSHVGELAILSFCAEARGVELKNNFESNILFSFLIAVCVVSRGLVFEGIFWYA